MMKIEDKFCKGCKKIQSKYDDFCSDCGEELQEIENINGVGVNE